MAGIGFELKKLYSEENSGAKELKADFYSAFATVGPWLITVLFLKILEQMSKIYIKDLIEIKYFTISVGYIFIFSQIISSPWQLYLNRYVADCIYQKKFNLIKASLVGILKLNMLISFVIGGVFISFSSLPRFFNLCSLALFFIMSSLWIINIYLSIFKDYVHIIKSYMIGGIICVLTALAIFNIKGLDQFTYFPAMTLTFAYLLGMSTVFFSLVSMILGKLKGNIKNEYEFLNNVIQHKSLIFTALFLSMGVWGHLILHWYFGDAIKVGNVYRESYLYSSALVYSFMATVPTIIYFNVIMETDFYLFYKAYYESLRRNFNLGEVERARKNMLENLRAAFSYIFGLQLLITLVLCFGIEKFLSFLNIDNKSIEIFKTLCFATLCNTLLQCFIIILLYFDKRKSTLKTVAAFFITSVGFEWIAIQIGPSYYGSGFFLGNLIALIYANYLLEKEMVFLNYDTFYKENFGEEPIPKLLQIIKNILYKRTEIIIFILQLIIFSGGNR